MKDTVIVGGAVAGDGALSFVQLPMRHRAKIGRPVGGKNLDIEHVDDAISRIRNVTEWVAPSYLTDHEKTRGKPGTDAV